MKRRNSLGLLASAPLAAIGAVRTPARSAGARQLLIAEPAHNLSYLPLYIAIANGYFKPLEVSTATLLSGSTHTNAVINGSAWGFIGGPEHNAYAYLKGINLRAIVNVVNRGAVYFAARKGLTPGRDLKAFFKGKIFATAPYGGTVNSILRYVLFKHGLDPKTDITLLEVQDSAVPAILSQGKADIAVVSEPVLSRGIENGIWDLFYDVPKALGPYAYSCVSVSLDELNRDPATAKSFVEGVQRGLAFTRDHRDEAAAAAQKAFPDLSAGILKVALDRCYADNYWEWDGKITRASIATGQAVVKAAGLLTADVPYNDVVDAAFF